MPLDLVAEIERLTQRRAALETEVAAIDQQLERVRVAIGLPFRSNGNGHQRPKPTPAVGEQTKRDILRVLAEAEPQRAKQIAERVGTTTTRQALAVLANQGVLVRRLDVRGKAPGGGYWYARTAEAFNGHPDTDPTNQPAPASDDELG